MKAYMYGVTIQIKLLWQNFCTVLFTGSDFTKRNLNVFWPLLGDKALRQFKEAD